MIVTIDLPDELYLDVIQHGYIAERVYRVEEYIYTGGDGSFGPILKAINSGDENIPPTLSAFRLLELVYKQVKPKTNLPIMTVSEFLRDRKD